jgi:DNA-binding CsgD family transcriptional regulator/tetratricopeptide (TPR) repeat protein
VNEGFISGGLKFRIRRVAETLQVVSPIGRQRQLDKMRHWLGELSAGHGRAVLVEGEPGIGKSSLVRLAAKEAAAEGSRVCWAACDELSQAFPLAPLLDALGALSGAGRRGGARITELLGADGAPGNRVDLVAAAAERLLAMVDDVCAQRPLLLIVEDLQWADPATVMTLGRLARSVRQLPLLVVGTTRPVPHRDDLVALRRGLPADSVLRLRSLSESEVARFVKASVGGTPSERLLGLAAGAGGNPLYLTELLDALVRAGRLFVDDDRIEVSGLTAPDSLAAAIADRLEFLDTPVRRLLRAAALLGCDFAVADLAAVTSQRVNELLPLLDEAILAGVLLDDGPELSFRHPLLRAALYEGMPPAVRAAWHLDAARALIEIDAPADRVARQLLPAVEEQDGSRGAEDWIVRWLATASQQLVGHAPRAAIPLLRWAVAGIPAGVAPHDLLNCRLADALFRVGDATAAAEVASATLAHVDRPDLLVDLHWTLTGCRAREGRSEETLTALEEALDTPGVRPGDRARLLVLTARAQRDLGRLDTAGQVADAALTAASAAGDRWATGWALGIQTIVAGMLGETATALPLFDRALAVAEGDPALADLRLVLQINQAVTLGDLDRYDDAINAASQVRQLADEAGNVVRLEQAQSVLGELLFDVGRWDDALAEIDLLSGVAKNPTVECCDHGVAATIGLHRGDAAATRHLQDTQRYASWLGERVIGSLVLAKSLDREQAEEPSEALAVLMNGLTDTAEEIEQTAELLADAVRLAVSVGDHSAARLAVRRAEEVAHDSEVPHLQALAPHCVGLLEHDPEPLLRAAGHYQDAGRVLPQAQALEAAGLALADGGDINGARMRFTDAFSLYTTLGADWDLARTQATFRTYGIRRGPHVRHRRSDHGWESLTPAEEKVVGLVARGMSNPQIAAHLFLSRRTVQTHVSHILAKLNLRSRIDIAREASRRDGLPNADPALDA